MYVEKNVCGSEVHAWIDLIKQCPMRRLCANGLASKSGSSLQVSLLPSLAASFVIINMGQICRDEALTACVKSRQRRPF